MSKRKFQITVIGNASANNLQSDMAYQVGLLVAKLKAVLVTGGRGGVMEAAAKGAAEASGLTIGILPSEDFAQSNPYNQIVIPTGLGHARNALTVLAADVVVAIGGGAGTLSEIAFASIYRKPIFAFAAAEGWAKIMIENKRSELNGKIIPFNDIDELEALLQAEMNKANN